MSVVQIRDLPERIGEEVTLQGWLYNRRGSGKIQFLEVRDGSGLCQCTVEAATADAFEAAKALTQESSLELTGTVRADDRSVGGCEITIEKLRPLHIAETYPISRKAHGIDFLLSNRHLHFRSRRPQAILRIRHTIIDACRTFFNKRDFILVDTPILTVGAGEDTQSLFEVDYFDRKAYLAQTGQLYLESACMAFGKVYCFGPTFRAEKSKTRRHLTEFWMLEPEIAFAELDDVMELAEAMICEVVSAVVAKHRSDLELLGRDVTRLEAVQAPFPRMTYSEAVDVLRGEETRRQLEAELAELREQLDEVEGQVKDHEAQLQGSLKAWKREKLQQELLALREQEEELNREIENVPTHLELAQNFEWGKDLGGSDETILSRRDDRPLFVTDYPRQAKAFYMKVSDDDSRVVRNMDLLAPEGYGEIIGGSQREENLDNLLDSMAAMGLEPDDYSWYLDLRRYGSVPHGGFGLGVERLVTWICGLKHVRETIPFPRTMGRLTP